MRPGDIRPGRKGSQSMGSMGKLCQTLPNPWMGLGVSRTCIEEENVPQTLIGWVWGTKHLDRRKGRRLGSIHQPMALGAPQEPKEIRWDYTACLVTQMPCLSHRKPKDQTYSVQGSGVQGDTPGLASGGHVLCPSCWFLAQTPSFQHLLLLLFLWV